jgi:hypothetical protein
MSKIIELLAAPFDESQCESYQDGDITLFRVKKRFLIERFVEVCGSVPELRILEEYDSEAYIELKGELVSSNLAFSSGHEYGGSPKIAGEGHQARKSARTNLFARCCTAFNMTAPDSLISKPIENGASRSNKTIAKAPGFDALRHTIQETADSKSEKKEIEAPVIENKTGFDEKERAVIEAMQERYGGLRVIKKATVGFDAEFYSKIVELTETAVGDLKLLFMSMGIPGSLWSSKQRVSKQYLAKVYRELYDYSDSDCQRAVTAWKEADFNQEEEVKVPPPPRTPEKETEKAPEKQEPEVEKQEEKKEDSEEEIQGYDMTDDVFKEMTLEQAIAFKWTHLAKGEEVGFAERCDCIDSKFAFVSDLTWDSSTVDEGLLKRFPSFDDFRANVHPGYASFIKE